MGVQIVADQDQVLGLAVARMIRDGLHLARPIHGRAPRGGVGRTPLAQRLRKHPEGAGAALHVCVVGGGTARAAGCGGRLSARSGLGCSSLQITG